MGNNSDQIYISNNRDLAEILCNHLSLLRDPEAAIDRTRGVGNNCPVEGRVAPTTDSASFAVEKCQFYLPVVSVEEDVDVRTYV